MLRNFNRLCKRFPSVPGHRIAKAVSLKEGGTLPTAAFNSGSGPGSGGEEQVGVLPNAAFAGESGPGMGRDPSNSSWGKAKDPCMGNLSRFSSSEAEKMLCGQWLGYDRHRGSSIEPSEVTWPRQVWQLRRYTPAHAGALGTAASAP